MAMVTVRYWAAAKQAAGVAEEVLTAPAAEPAAPVAPPAPLIGPAVLEAVEPPPGPV